ncbi:hypothetical protein [Streptomyces sp. NPDC059278]|uniref:hypothetical protein n=1 Tax=Streptomyces sp. NPDC059278 TaxID=3346801 RepID=UPI0036740E02
MHPKRFASGLLSWICAEPQVRARSFEEAGYTECPFGVELWLPSGAVVYLQAVGADAPGHRPGTPLPPVHGDPLPVSKPVALPGEGPTEMAAVERWLRWRITTGQSAEISRVSLFQNRNGRNAVPYGLALTFHSGARVWLYFRHATPAGRQPGTGPLWRDLASV